jgi:tricorn protease
MMRSRVSRWLLAAVLCLASLPRPARAAEDARLLRMPDLHGDRIVFVYAGDLWTVGRTGGTAQRLTTHPGLELYPKFSPDGSTIAFTGEYDGNPDVYLVPQTGGAPRRITYHPGNDLMTEWYPDGKSLLMRGNRNSPFLRCDQFYRLPIAGGLAEKLPLWNAGYADFSADGTQLAFVSPQSDRRLWKRYRGGNAADILVYDFTTKHSENITQDWVGPDEWPMFHGRTIYYTSDRGGHTVNLWAYDLDRHTHRQVTSFDTFDVKWPSAGPDGIVFENGGWLWVLDLPSETLHQIHVALPDDQSDIRPRYRNVAAYVGGFDLAPSGKRAVIEARGDLFTLAAERGTARNLTQTPGCASAIPRGPPMAAGSPTGRTLRVSTNSRCPRRMDDSPHASSRKVSAPTPMRCAGPRTRASWRGPTRPVACTGVMSPSGV